MSPMPAHPLTIEYALLGLLQSGPMHGYQLHQTVNDPAGLRPVWTLKQSQLYALMSRLEEEGCVRVRSERVENRPPRRVFHLTTAGQRAFAAWASAPVERPRQMRQEFQLKLYFARLKGAAAVKELAAAQRRVCEGWLAELGAEDEGEFAQVVGEYRAGQIRAMIEWLVEIVG